MTNLTEYINHPQQLDRDSLYELRSMLALYPYYQPARLLMLRNLYLLHDPSFDEELKKAAFYITDREKLFQMVEAAHYQLKRHATQEQPSPQKPVEAGNDRTISLIDGFLDSIPKDEVTENEPGSKKRKPTPADATVDYVAYLLECERDEVEEPQEDVSAPPLRGHSLIDSFIEQEGGKIVLDDSPEYVPELADEMADSAENGADSGFFTETLARIYIKQGKYDKALQIIRQLSLNYPKKNAY
ncbi:MAG: tetratricopeptide repeat protein, partial [Prevotella sp.]